MGWRVTDLQKYLMRDLFVIKSFMATYNSKMIFIKSF